jgi:NADH-quinone oxidoreductase subunit B
VAVNEQQAGSAVQRRGPVALGIPSLGAPERSFGTAFEAAPKPMKVVLNWGRRYSLWVFNFGLACCAIEFIAASMARHDFIRLGVIPFAPGPRQADLMVVSGTVTDKMAPAVKRLYEQMPEPKYVISFGACSNCGGPYWDSYSVTKGIDQVIPVDVYVPGCPPRPEALLQGIIRLQEKIAAEGTQSTTDTRDGEGTGGGAGGGRGRTFGRAPKPRKPKAVAPAKAAPATVAPPQSTPPQSKPPQGAPAQIAPPPGQAPTPTQVPTAPLPTPTPAPTPTPTQETPAPPNDGAAATTEPIPELPPTVELKAVTPPKIDPVARTTELPVVKVPRRRYFRELRRARDHGLSLFDKAASDQEWEHNDDER